MPQPPPTTFRIEDLKARLKLEPKSRIFYPLAEELRKIDRFQDAEKILRDGLAVHTSYISAWISLGRVLLEQEKHQAAVEVLQKASALDPGNVVAARLLADAYLGAGQPVEAIKKYKLVRALLPAAEDLEEVIARLEVQLSALPQPEAPVLEAAPPPPAPEEAPAPEAAQPPPPPVPAPEEAPAPEAAQPAAPIPQVAEPSEARTDTEPFRAEEPPVPLTPAFSGEAPVQAVDVDAAMSGAGFTAAAPEFAQEVVLPRADVIGEGAVTAEEQRDFPPTETRFPTMEEPFSIASEPPAVPPPPSELFDETQPFGPEGAFATKTVADLYAKQGHLQEASEIYSKLSEKQPEAAAPAPPAGAEGSKRKEVVNRLESWLAKVARK